MLWIIETKVSGQWEHLDATTDESGERWPMTYTSRAEARAELREHKEAMREAGITFQRGDYRIVREA